MKLTFRDIPTDEPLTIQFPGCEMVIHNNLDSDDGICAVTVTSSDPDLEVIPFKTQRSGMYLISVYGPHEGDPGHYNPDGTKETA